jgi:hypothetical protein
MRLSASSTAQSWVLIEPGSINTSIAARAGGGFGQPAVGAANYLDNSVRIHWRNALTRGKSALEEGVTR